MYWKFWAVKTNLLFYNVTHKCIQCALYYHFLAYRYRSLIYFKPSMQLCVKYLLVLPSHHFLHNVDFRILLGACFLSAFLWLLVQSTTSTVKLRISTLFVMVVLLPIRSMSIHLTYRTHPVLEGLNTKIIYWASFIIVI